MLTPEAYLARKWRSLPLLQSVLEGLLVPGTDSMTSVYESPSERVGQLLEIVALALAHSGAIKLLAETDRLAVHRELEFLRQELAGVAEYLTTLKGRVDQLHHDIDES